MSQTYVLDSTVVIDILHKRAEVADQFRKALVGGARVLLCPVVYYETLRKLVYDQATKQTNFFRQLANSLIYDELERLDWDEASYRWSQLRRRGHQTQDADLLIGVFASRRGAILVTSNEKHFLQFDITIEDWRN